MGNIVLSGFCGCQTPVWSVGVEFCAVSSNYFAYLPFCKYFTVPSLCLREPDARNSVEERGRNLGCVLSAFRTSVEKITPLAAWSLCPSVLVCGFGVFFYFVLGSFSVVNPDEEKNACSSSGWAVISLFDGWSHLGAFVMAWWSWFWKLHTCGVRDTVLP